MGHEFGKLIGGRLCLEFVNTVTGRTVDRVVGERLTSYDALIAWSKLTEALAPREAAALVRLAAARPADTLAVMQRSLSVREAMYRIFQAAIDGRAPKKGDLAVLNREVQIARAHEQLIASPHFEWKWDNRQEALDRMLWPVLRSATELLTSPDVKRLGQCHGEACGWLFLDTSRSGRRQWCDMADCGTIAKVRRFRAKQRIGHSGILCRDPKDRRS
jgi:predicted RNA-binding Zn ribbon-like protein